MISFSSSGKKYLFCKFSVDKEASHFEIKFCSIQAQHHPIFWTPTWLFVCSEPVPVVVYSLMHLSSPSYGQGNHAFWSVSVLLFQQNKANRSWCSALRLQIAFEDREKERTFCAAAEWPLHSQPTLKRRGSCLTASASPGGVCTGTDMCTSSSADNYTRCISNR